MRIVMLEAVMFSWRNREDKLEHRAPEIGDEVDVPDDVAARLPRSAWALATIPTPASSSSRAPKRREDDDPVADPPPAEPTGLMRLVR